MIKNYKQNVVGFDDIIHLYELVGWQAYTQNTSRLKTALDNSSYVYLKLDQNQNLLGIIRGQTDKISINYIQDIIVHPKFHSQGIGSELLQYVFHQFSDVRTQLLLTDDEPSQLAFYLKNQMRNINDLERFKLNCFIK
jgi:ribosomal protein S18 acetylase RimI-like enzyme